MNKYGMAFRKSSVMTQKDRTIKERRMYLKVAKLCTFVVLNDCFDFTEEQVQEFNNRFDELVMSLKYEVDDMKSIEKEIKERFNIDLEIR